MIALLARRASSARLAPRRARWAAAPGAGASSRAAVIPADRCTSHDIGGGTLTAHRPLHATSAVRDDPARRPRREGPDKGGGAGFGAFLDRRNQGSKGASAPSNRYPSAGALVDTNDDTMDRSEEAGWPGEHADPDRDAEHEHYFGHYFDEQRDESHLQEWHRQKEGEYGTLAAATERMLGTSIATQGDVEGVLAAMRRWNAFAAGISSELHELSDFRRSNPQYPPSEFMATTTCNAAEMGERLLAHLLSGKLALDPTTEVKAYQLAMTGWSHAFSPRSGDRCEDILERYGERFGGDMNHMPSISAYKTVLRAHLKSCSSYSPANSDNGEGGSPGEKALSLSALLANVYTAGDLVLKPDAELYSLAIAVVRNTLLDHQMRRRFRHDERKRPLEMDLAEGLVDAFGRMEACLDEEVGGGEKVGDKDLSLEQWHGVLGAYADALAVVARIPLDDTGINAAERLSKLERFLDANSPKIARSIDQSGLDENEVRDLAEGMQRKVEESYASALLSGLILSKEGGAAFDGFDRALDNASSSDAIFQRMQGRSKPVQFLRPRPTPDHYQALIQCWCECVRKCYSTPESNDKMASLDVLPHLKAESLLKELESRFSGELDGSAHVAVMWAISQLLNWPAIYRQHDFFFAANAIDELLQRTMRGYQRGSIGFTSSATVAKMYNYIFRLNSKIHKGGERAVKRSLHLLDQMDYWYRESGGEIARPDAFTFSLILKTIANSGSESSASQAEAILQRMEHFGVKPREKHYLAAIRAHARVGQKDVADPQKAEAVLQLVKEKYAADQSVKPTAALYTACISAYGGSKKFNSISKVTELFEELKELHRETEDEAFRPDSQLYGAVIDAMSKAKSKGDASIRQALRLLDQMERSYDSGEIEAAPNRYAYTNLLRSISRSRASDRVTLAEDLIQRMEDRARQLQDETILPDVHAYTTLIQVLSHSGLDFAVERAQKWFQRMEARCAEGNANAKPNKVTYTALINCWRSSLRPEAGQEAENILELMETKYAGGDLDLKPDAYVYAAAIDTWARSTAHDKAGRAWAIYQRMKKQYAKGNMESRPNNVIMTSIIKACGYTRGGREDRQRALKVLLECMSDLQTDKYLGTTPLTYRSLLNAAKALVADDAARRPIAANIFEMCCRAGQLDRTVLEALGDVQPELYAKLPGEVPAKWKRNVAQPKSAFADGR